MMAGFAQRSPKVMEADMLAAAHAYDRWEASPARWPIDRPSLSALKDLGLSDGQVARYFGVEQADVAGLRASYGIADQALPIEIAPPKRRRFAWRRRS
jgi:ABC-type taurine transport system substrate-binding protein